jgi:hypothetical protein
MTGVPDDGFTYEWEAKRKISDDVTLDCNFHLDSFPAVLTSKEHGRVLLSGPELFKLFEELADRFEYDIKPKDSKRKRI